MSTHANLAQICASDPDFDEFVIKTVEESSDGKGYYITYNRCWTFYVDKIIGHTPESGSKLLLWTMQASILRGIVIDGQVYRYKTEADILAERQKKIEEDRVKSRAQFPERDARIAKLPEVFRERIEQFQKAPNFREDLESYELFVCEQAVLFAEHFGSIEALNAWCQLDWDTQKAALPALDEGHSGNTFGFACMLARAYMPFVETAHNAMSNFRGETPLPADPIEEILKWTMQRLNARQEIRRSPGALSPITGSEAYQPA